MPPPKRVGGIGGGAGVGASSGALRARASAARSRDVVSQVEDKLKLGVALPRRVLEATRSSLRVLKIRNPIGSFGRYDNEMKRACALLEYDVRDYNRNRGIGNGNGNGNATTNNYDNDNDNGNGNNDPIEIPMDKLARAAFMKPKDFRDFHEKIGNFRDNLRATVVAKTRAKDTNSKDGKGDKTLQSSSRNHNSNNSNNEKNNNNNNNKTKTKISNPHQKSGIALAKSSIPSLAIQMGAFVPNSSGVALRAQKLFRDLVALLKRSSKQGGNWHGLMDVQKNQASYEAACFYLVATTTATTTSTSNNGGREHSAKDLPQPSRPRRRRRRANSLRDHLDDAAENDPRLDLSTFLDVTKEVASQFQTVLDYVRELQTEIQSTATKTAATATARTSALQTIQSRKRPRTDDVYQTNQARDGEERSDHRTSKPTTTGRADYNINDNDNDDDNATVRLREHGIDDDDDDNEAQGSGTGSRIHTDRGTMLRRPNPVFDQWKARVLGAAVAAAKQTQTQTQTQPQPQPQKSISGAAADETEDSMDRDGGGQSLEESSESQSQSQSQQQQQQQQQRSLLDFAAREILARHGLIRT